MPSIPRVDLSLRRLWRTTAFRLTILYAAVFIAGVMALLALVYADAAGLLTAQMDQVIIGQARALSREPVDTLPARIDQAESADLRHVNYYGLFSENGIWITGNVRVLPAYLRIDGPPGVLRGPHFQPGARGLAKRLPWGEILVVGFDAKVLSGLRNIILQSLLVSGGLILVVGLSLGAAMSLGPLRRIQGVQDASQRIIDGDLTARLPVSSRGDEIDRLAGIANTMMAEVVRLLGEVLSVGNNVAHDLRTPLTRLRALLYRAEQSTGEGDPRQAMLEQALSETDSLLARFRALQRIAEIDRRERRAGFAEVELEPLLRDLAELYQPVAEDGGQALTLRIGPARPIQADRELLFEALSNLMANALKFTPEGGQVTLTLSDRPRGPRLEVADSGPGIAAEEREAVLQRFYRSRRDQGTPGSGLGLSIVAAVARLHEFELTLADAAPGLRVAMDCWPIAPKY